MMQQCGKICFLFFFLFLEACFPLCSFGQYDPLYLQYFNNQLVINPAFTGFRNTLAVDLSVRRQWVGFDGAPSASYLSVHTPINKTKLAVGFFFQSYKSGPVSSKHFVLDYSYLVRLDDRMFLSLGLSGGVLNNSINFSDLVLIDPDDPDFQRKYNKIVPLAGAGAVFFTPLFYVGVSRPAIYFASKSEGDAQMMPSGSYYLMGGVNLPEFSDFTSKVSALGRLNDDGYFIADVTGRVFYKNTYSIGLSYKPNHSWSAMLDFQITRNISVIYSYDFPLPKMPFASYGSHEITLSYDVFKFIRRNKDRQFKKKKDAEGDAIRSIRYF